VENEEGTLSTHETVRAAAGHLPYVTERRGRSNGSAELVANDRCFVSLPDDDPGLAYAVTSEGALAALLARSAGTLARAEGRRGCWVQIHLEEADADVVQELVLDAWRLRSQKRAQWTYLHPRFVADIEPILTELRSWPELTEGGLEHFALDGKQFLHFHCGWDDRRADVKLGDTWGPPIPIPLGGPQPAAVASILAEMRRRLEMTVAASTA
jgi:hypothetical protein